MSKKKILILIVFLLTSTKINASMYRPWPEDYHNPYKLMEEKQIKTKKDVKWRVFANQKGAPIYKNAAGKKIGAADYLEPFIVISKDRHYLNVSSLKRDIKGWMDLRHLIFMPRAIMNEKTSVFHKVFLRIRIQEESEDEHGIDILRFRNGPGSGNGPYEFLTDKEDIPHVGNLFLYVYCVFFNADKSNNEIDEYLNSDNFKDADYFLVGDVPSFMIDDEESFKKRIRGWIPRAGAVLWDTRQALEVYPERTKNDAHKFADLPLLKKYFSLKKKEERDNFLKENAKKIVIDNGCVPPSKGQYLRDIVLGLEHKSGDLIAEYIGFTGNVEEKSSFADHQEFLADFQEGMKYLEIFFLVDASMSMEPCLNAVSDVTRNMINQVKSNNIELSLNGAVYRDETEGPLIYEEWNPDEEPSLSKWFKKLSQERAFSDPADDYPEAVFHGIYQALNGWDFKHKFSTRVILVLGDAGDNTRGPSKEEIIKELEKKMVLPIAIHFDHKCTNEKDPKKCEEEKIAMNNFRSQFETIHKSFYDFISNSVEIKSVPESEISNELNRHILNTANFIYNFLKLLPDIRLGIRSIKDTICSMAYKNNNEYLEGCISCKNIDELKTFFRTHKMIVDNAGIGLILAHLKKLQEKDMVQWEYVVNNPEVGFTEGVIPLRDRETRFTRPVLLLSDAELLKIESTIMNIKYNYSFCSEKANRELLVNAISTIIGEILQTNPECVTREQVNRWFKLTVDTKENYIGAKDIILLMCREENHKTWKDFLKRLEKVTHLITKLRRERDNSSKLFRDLDNNAFYWIYPEEIFPPLVID